MQWRIVAALAALFPALHACAGARHSGTRATAPLASQCEVQHSLHGSDTVTARIDRLADAWLVSLSMHVALNDAGTGVNLRGLGRVVNRGGALHCDVIEHEGGPSAQFDEAMCLDELDSVADLLAEAEHVARPGQTVSEDIQLRSRRHQRSQVRVAVNFHASATVERDPSGRAVRVLRREPNAQEEIAVRYPAGVVGRCLPDPGGE